VQKLKEFCPGSLQPNDAKLRLFLLKNLTWVMPGQGFSFFFTRPNLLLFGIRVKSKYLLSSANGSTNKEN